jgi:hypothetical protein
VLPLLRQQRGGHIFHVSSLGGRDGQLASGLNLRIATSRTTADKDSRRGRYFCFRHAFGYPPAYDAVLVPKGRTMRRVRQTSFFSPLTRLAHANRLSVKPPCYT